MEQKRGPRNKPRHLWSNKQRQKRQEPKMGKMGPNETDKLLHSKGNKRKTKRQLTEWEKIVSSDAPNKSLIS